MKTWKRAKIFVSSTFKDMDMERDALKNIVVPKLNEAFLYKNLHIDIVDLRHSVETDPNMNVEERENRVFQVCMDEIDSCKPYFLGLVGHRYGWKPDLLGVHSDLFQKIRLPEDFPITPDKLSVTVCEFIHALFSDMQTPLHSFIMLRGEKSYAKLDENSRKEYMDDKEDGELIKTFRTYLESLKGSNTIVSYDLDLTDVGGTALQQWCDIVYKKLYDEFNKELTGKSSVSEEDYIIRQKKFISRHSYAFKGRERVIGECLEIFKNRKTLHIYQNRSGLGATSLSCQLYTLLSDKDLFFCLYHNTDTSPDADTYDNVFYYWNRQMLEFLNQDHTYLNSIRNNADALYEEFTSLYKQITDTGHAVVIFTDGTERLPGHYSLKLPFNYWVNVVATGESSALVTLRPYVLTELEDSDCELIAKNLRGPVREALLQKANARNVKWLQKAVHILDHLNHNDYTLIRSTELQDNKEENIIKYIVGVINDMPDDFSELSLFWIDRLKNIYGEFVDQYLHILSVTCGVNDYELSYLTGRNTDWCTYFRYVLGTDIVFENGDGYIEINQEVGRKLRQNAENTQLTQTCRKVMEYIDGLPVTSEIYQRNYFSVAMHLRDYEKCLAYITDEKNYTERVVESPSMSALLRMSQHESADFFMFAQNVIALAPLEYKSFHLLNLWFSRVILFDKDLHIAVEYMMMKRLEAIQGSEQFNERLALALCEIYNTAGSAYINSSRSDSEEMWGILNLKGVALSEKHRKVSRDWSAMYVTMLYDAYDGFSNLNDRWEFLKECFSSDEILNIDYDDRHGFLFYAFLLREYALLLPQYTDCYDSFSYIKKAYDVITKVKNRALADTSRPVESDSALCDWLLIVLCIGRLSENFGNPSRDIALKIMRDAIEEMFSMSDKYTHMHSQGVLLSELVAAYAIKLSETDPVEAMNMVDRMLDLCLDKQSAYRDLDPQYHVSYYSRYVTFMPQGHDITYMDISFAWPLAARLHITKCGTVNIPSRYPIQKEDLDTVMKLFPADKTSKWDRELDREFVLLTAIAAKLRQLRDSGFKDREFTESMIALYDALYKMSSPYYRKRNFRQRADVDIIKREYICMVKGLPLSLSQTDLEAMIDNEEYELIINRYRGAQGGSPEEFYYLGLAYLRNGMEDEAFYLYRFLSGLENLPEGIAFSCKVNCLIAALAARMPDEFLEMYESLSAEDKNDTDVVPLYSAYRILVKYGKLELDQPYGYKL